MAAVFGRVNTPRSASKTAPTPSGALINGIGKPIRNPGGGPCVTRASKSSSPTDPAPMSDAATLIAAIVS